jgi:hypothetical protein
VTALTNELPLVVPTITAVDNTVDEDLHTSANENSIYWGSSQVTRILVNAPFAATPVGFGGMVELVILEAVNIFIASAAAFLAASDSVLIVLTDVVNADKKLRSPVDSPDGTAGNLATNQLHCRRC